MLVVVHTQVDVVDDARGVQSIGATCVAVANSWRQLPACVLIMHILIMSHEYPASPLTYGSWGASRHERPVQANANCFECEGATLWWAHYCVPRFDSSVWKQRTCVCSRYSRTCTRSDCKFKHTIPPEFAAVKRKYVSTA